MRVAQEGSADWFERVVEAVPSPLLIFGPTGSILHVNRAVETLLGTDRRALLGTPLAGALRAPIGQDGFDASALFGPQGLAAEGAVVRELVGVRGDGSQVPVEARLERIDGAGSPCMLATVVDTTERRREQQRFRIAVEAAPNAMLMVDRLGLVALANANAQALFGYTQEQFVGLSVDELVPHRFRAHHSGFMRAFTGKPQARAMGAGRDLFGVRRDGSEVPVEIGLNPIDTAEGPFTLVAIIDISERRRAEAVQERLAAIVESSEDAILSKTLDGKIASWNRGAQRLFGYTADEAIGRPVVMLVPERLADEELQLLALVRDSKRSTLFEAVRLRKDGSEVEVSVQLSPILNRLGEVVGESSITRDITEQKRRAAELERSNA